MEIKAGQQLYVNGKWYMDVICITEEGKAEVRIKYFEGANKNVYLYKNIPLPTSLFTDIVPNSFIVYTKVNEVELKKIIGSLINRLVKEKDITKMFEDAGAAATGGNTGGMGAVASPGMSGTPGLPGAAGSGDISGGILPASEFGLQIHPKANKKARKKLTKKSKKKSVVKQPVIMLRNEAMEVDTDEMTENDYKLKLYQFLDYPTDNEYDQQFIDTIDKQRSTFLEISSQRITQYFKDLYKVNKSIIKSRTSDWFQNNLLILGDITETDETI